MVLQDPNVRIAFGLVLGAGAATAVGASVVFFPSLVKLASRRLLAGALGASAGVMLYVSFVEIFSKTMGYFQEASNTPEVSFAYTTCCFFGGIVFMMVCFVVLTSRA
jgi:ZIP family zinc transporter